MAEMEELLERVKRRIAVWDNDAKGCRRAAKDVARQEDYYEAIRFTVAAETMETVVREARALIKDQSNGLSVLSSGEGEKEQGSSCTDRRTPSGRPEAQCKSEGED